MKAVILAGGLGTRLSEETTVRPKPMVEIGGRPILWHIMKHLRHHGLREFVVALGYKGEVIKQFFLDYHRLSADLTVDIARNTVSARGQPTDDWVVHLVETGARTNTGGRVKALAEHVGDAPFLLTYGDGVCDVDVRALLAFHGRHRPALTLTAVRPPARFGGLDLDGTIVRRFAEKSQTDAGWINGGFMVVEPEVLESIPGPESSLEYEVLERLAREGRLGAYRHEGFWQCMDTQRDMQLLQHLWDTHTAPWKVWPDG